MMLELEDVERRRLPASGGVLLLCQTPRGRWEEPSLMAALRARRVDWSVANGPDLRDAEAALERGEAVLAWVSAPLAAGKLGHAAALAEAERWVALARRCRAGIQALRLDGGKRKPWLRALGLDKEGMRHKLIGSALPQARPRLRGAISALLPSTRLWALAQAREAAELVLLRFWLLAHRGRTPKETPGPMRRWKARRQAPIASALPPALLEGELAALPTSAKLAEVGELSCWVAEASQIPNILREIGRLREESFRALGEGTGQPLDLDRFDQHYQHLFLWHKGQRCVAGAYRFAPVDQVLASHGMEGLYTHSLLRFEPALLQRLDPALELGRSFVAPGFQRSFAPLLLLWRGLGAWIAEHPRYRRLFGLVTMSADFQPLSRELLASFAKQHLFRRDLAGLTRPRRPYLPAYIPGPHDALTWRLGSSLDEISAWVSELEPDGKGLPVLFRQYAGLGAFFFGFNVDPAFGHALDGLICVDLAQSDPPMLARTMGAEGAEAFLRRHGVAAA